MAYQALYRQWRAKTFSEIVGQESIVKTLRNQISTGRTSHAYLFCGSRGTGKTSIARILSRAVNCENPQNGDPCCECESCRRLLSDTSLDVMEIDAASNNGVDEIRELREKVQYPPQHGKKKVYIIDEVHMLSSAAFNALLKTLEEPPEYVLFILATTEPQKLPATILSRCQRYDFGRIPAHQIAAHLRQACEGAGAQGDDEAFAAIARAAEGGMRDALSILDMCLGYGQTVTEELVRSVLGTSDKSVLFEMGDALKSRDAAHAMTLIDKMMRTGREPQVFSRDMAQHLRSLLLAQSCPQELGALLDVTKEDAASYIAQAKDFPASALLRDMELFLKVEAEMRYASSPRAAVEVAALKAISIPEEQDVSALLARMDQLESELAQTKAMMASGSFRPAPQQKSGASATMEGIPAAPAAPAVPLEGQELWASILLELKKTDPVAFTFAGKGRFAGVKDGVLRLSFEADSGNDIFINKLNSPAKKEIILGIAGKLSENVHGFEAFSKSSVDPRKQKQENDTMSSLVSTFGRDKIEVE